MSIIPVTRDPKSGGTPAFFEEKVMRGDKFIGTAERAESPTLAIQYVRDNLGAIGYGPAPHVCDQKEIKALEIIDKEGNLVSPCNEPKRGKKLKANACAFINEKYPINSRKLYVIFREDNGISQKSGQALAHMFLSNEGQKLMQQTLIAIRPTDNFECRND
jgi:ABC-type phosphate transport system substrate-binding protein